MHERPVLILTSVCLTAFGTQTLAAEGDAARIAEVIRPAEAFEQSEPYEALPGGAATLRNAADRDAFSHPSANMSFERELDFLLGKALFEKIWVSAPSSTLASDGLGPLYDARSCQACHIRDGRGQPPDQAGSVSMVVRLAQPGGEPDPTYGRQLQDLALPGHAAETQISVSYREIPVHLAGGETVFLQQPDYEFEALAYGPLASETVFSARIAPPMIGLGLLEAVPEENILALADEDDRDGDGISGRANMVWSRDGGKPMLGRFGWKAGEATIRDQSAAAFANDIGISSPLFPDGWGDCSAAQATCRAAPHGDGDIRETEIDGAGLELVSFYSRNLAVPERRLPDDPEVLRGKQVFYETGCSGCHVPKHVTARLPDQPEQNFQLIWPYTDLLLHDMGDGLADDLPEGRANGREWRTPPLWGIGLTAEVSGHSRFLHDGRARSLLEAVLWHGGEAEPQQAAVIAMTPADRAVLIRFLESL
ncbi:di-heme oxidoredictase family protein [Ruegeria sp. PrR005]|uniref:C-type cytochrome n=1 Tax=Ruegeria sp. PrR005 TaxID=2706882 RepID=A0A6B2NPH1_9RHOB|nr:di-heme oxidoredictase family protein [Ruegeria sp. PrR005]NDW46006.1 c-type cytochrome [Ruegeria sp. PrR005]